MSRDSMEALVEHRRRLGIGNLDECWEGVWHWTEPTGKHQRVAARIYTVHAEFLEGAGRASVWPSVNVTDREVDWKHNHRCPDGSIILPDHPGHWLDDAQTAFVGGPDQVLEVLSPDDDTHRKLPFYAALGVREVLVVEPGTGRIQLWRLESGAFREVAAPLRSEVTGLVYAQGPAGLEITDPATGATCKI